MVLRRHLGMDVGLPAALRMVRVFPFPYCSLFRPRHARNNQLKPLDARDDPLPTALRHGGGYPFGLRHLQMLYLIPENDPSQDCPTRVDPRKRRSSNRRSHPLPVQRDALRNPPPFFSQHPRGKLLVERVLLRRTFKHETHFSLRRSTLLRLYVEGVLPHARPKQKNPCNDFEHDEFAQIGFGSPPGFLR